MPRNVDLRSRDYFKAVVDGFDGTYVSSLQVGDVNRQTFFGVSRAWRDAAGALKGVIDVAVSPVFFQDFYAAVVGEGEDGVEGKLMSLVRSDGQLLVRYPALPGPLPVAPRISPFFAAIQAHPDEGVYDSQSLVDPGRTPRLLAYRRVQGYPLYVVAGRSWASIMAGWRRSMAGHLIYAVPVTLALFAVTWTALVRTRRELDALRWAHHEIERRERAEAALLKSQRLEAVGQMTGGVAHDFNNLLTVILGSAELLARRADDPARVRGIARQIVLAAQHGGKVTQQLLTFSRRQLVQAETVDLNQMLREFRPLLERAASEAVRIQFDLAAGLPSVLLDPGHFEAAILNLVGNGRDAMPDGGTIRITTRTVQLGEAEMPDLPAGDYAKVAVIDRGSGMTAQTAAKAFEPFFTTKEFGKGTGLGLSQVYGFAKQAGGDVQILSQLGQGTSVELLLPCVPDRTPATLQEGDPPFGTHPTDGEVVLIVEDEAGVRDIAVESLHELGYATLTAPSAQAALARLRGAERVDVLFSDVVMPGGMNGVQLSTEARRLRPGLRVLLTSGYTADATPDGVADLPLLTKPYDRDKLARSLRAVLHG